MSAHRKQLDALAGALLSRETLNEREILQVTGLMTAARSTVPSTTAGYRSHPPDTKVANRRSG